MLCQCPFLRVSLSVSSNILMATKRKSMLYSRDEALARHFQYQDDDTLLDSDEEEGL